MNHFEVFGLPRRLGIDAGELQRRFHELSRRHHPDFHQTAPPDEQARALEASARVNAAYRTLRDPIARVEYLVRVEEGRETIASGEVPDTPKAPPALLAEMFEIQEALQEARMGGVDDAARAALAEQRAALEARLAAEEARITGALSAQWDGAMDAERPSVLAAFKDALARRAYLRTVIDDLADALEAGSEAERGRDVAHRRH